MTLNEFKSWLEGFEAAITGDAPTPDQWAAIKAKLATVTIVAPPVHRGLVSQIYSDRAYLGAPPPTNGIDHCIPQDANVA